MKKVYNKRVSVSSIIILVIVFCFSCNKKQVNTFNKEITYQRLLNNTDFFTNKIVDTYKVLYTSEGLNIEGFIAKPNYKESLTKLPAIIFCRGGNQSYGMINADQLKMINDLASQGYVVLASQLRGNISSTGVDEFGGRDVNDILKLIAIAKALDYVDSKNINVLGYSRGGMNAYQVSKFSDDINSIAVVGAPTNLFKGAKFRPKMYSKVFKPLIGDTVNNKKEYIKRSASFWVDRINEPTLILHGTDDTRVAVEEAQQMIDSLKKSNKKDFQYKIFEGGNHTLSNFKKERNSLILNWFKTHLK